MSSCPFRRQKSSSRLLDKASSETPIRQESMGINNEEEENTQTLNIKVLNEAVRMMTEPGREQGESEGCLDTGRFFEAGEIVPDSQHNMDGSEVPDTEEQKRKLSGQELDYFDPNLDVQDLFASFNERFFWGMLGMVKVKWSYTMTSRAGLCTYQERGGLCTIKLSAPLLSLRPRSDVAEALLHEMIHAYLFVTQNFKDTEDHGPEFQKHMHRINEEGGIKIHIYYQYLGEMSYNRRHIWRCAGPCRDQQPYFGFVMRTENRPPGPSDHWWHTHMRECGGNFEKISDKQKNGKEKNRNEKGKRKKTVARAKDVRTFSRSFGPENPSKSNPSDASSASTAVDESDKGESSKSVEQTEDEPDNSNEMEGKPGTSQSGDDFQSKPGTSRSSDDFQSKPCTSQVGDENVEPKTRRSKKKGLKGKKRKSSDAAEPNDSGADEKRPSVMCPVCAHGFDPLLINDHVNACMEEQQFMNEISPDEGEDYGQGQGHYGQCPLLGDYLDEEEAAERVEASLHFFVYDEDIAGDDEPGADKVRCPCCWKYVKEGKINEHIDACLTYNTLQNNPPDSP